MRRPQKRTVLILAALALLVGITVIVWEVADWPPVRLILKYGFPPTGGPTGNKRTIEGIEFVELKPGYCRVGSHFLCERGDLLGRVTALIGLSWGKPPDHRGSECPMLWIEIEKPLWIAKTEVTRAQFLRFSPRHHGARLTDDDERPITTVPHHLAVEFCQWLSEHSNAPVRLPHRAEWEYACRAGSMGDYCFGDEAERLREFAWFGDGFGSGPANVAEKQPNRWGLYDMHGNVAELVSPGVLAGGGHSQSPAEYCRSSSLQFSSPVGPDFSGRKTPTGSSPYTGFRPVFTPPESK